MWTTTTNWSPTGAPTSTDVVCNTTAQAISLTASKSVVGVLFDAGSLTLQSGVVLSLTDTTASTSRINALTAVGGGGLAGAGAVSLTGASNLSGVALTGSGVKTIAAGATLTLPNGLTVGTTTSTSAIAAKITNLGTINLTGGGVSLSGGTNVTGGSVLDNAGTLNVSVNASFSDGGTGAARPKIVNESVGVIEKNTSPDPSYVFVPLDNAGTVRTLSGTLDLQLGNSPGASDGGKLIAAAGTEIDSEGVRRLTSTATSTGSLVVNSGSLTVASGGSLSNLTQTGGVLSGSPTITGNLTWTGGTQDGTGTTTVGAGATLTIPPGAVYLDHGHRLLNQGAATLGASASCCYTQVLLSNAATVENAGSMSTQDSSGYGSYFSSQDATANRFLNDTGATFTGNGTSFFSTTMDNAGTFTVATGTTSLAGNSSGVSDTGTFSAASGAVLDLASGGRSFTSGQFTGAGVLSVSGATLNVASGVNLSNLTQSGGVLSGSPTITGNLTWTGGTQDGAGTTTVASGASLTIPPGGVYLDHGHRLLNQGTATLGQSGSCCQAQVLLSNASTVENAGTMTALDSGGYGSYFSNQDATANRFLNDTGATFTGNGTSSFSTTMENAGTFTVATGTTSLTGTSTQAGGQTTIASGATLSDSTPFVVAGGVLAGTGTISADVQGTGFAFAPGTPKLTVTGALSLTGASTWRQQVQSAAAASRANVSGLTTLAGTLAITTASGYTPALNDTFTILSAPAGVTGTFSQITGQYLPTGYYYSIAYTATTVKLVVKAAPTLTVTDVTLAEGNTGDADAVFTLTTSFAAPIPVSVQYATADGTATAPSDYASTSGTAMIPVGGTSTTIHVPVHGDTLYESNESFTLNLSNADGALPSRSSATGTITNDDAVPTLSVADASQPEGNTAGVMTFTVTASGAASAPMTVAYATTDGTATAPSDYAATSGTATIAAGALSTTISVPTVGDTTAEPDESFTVTLSSPTVATLSDATASGTLTDDDSAPPSTGPLTVRAGDARVVEGAGSITFPITLSHPAATSTSVKVTPKSGTGASGATAGADFTAAVSTITFAPGQTSKPLTVPVLADALPELNETFSVTLTMPSAGLVIADTAATGTIVDDDGLPAQVTVTDVPSAAEGSSAVFRLAVSGPVPAGAVVKYATKNGTAISGSDFPATTGTWTIPAGASSPFLDVPVPVTADGVAEGGEVFTLTTTTITGGPLVVADSAGTATIPASNGGTGGTAVNNGPRLRISDARVNEGGGSAAVTVSLDSPAATTVTVKATPKSGAGVSGATANADFTAGTVLVTFPAGSVSQTVNIPITGDAVAEFNETFTVGLSTPTGGAVIADTAGTVTINDDDGLPPQLTVSDAGIVTEGGVATFTVTLDTAPAASVSVTVSLSPSNPSRYGPPSSSALTFTPGGPLTQTVTVPVLNDGVAGQAATIFTLKAATTGQLDLADAIGSATIAAN